MNYEKKYAEMESLVAIIKESLKKDKEVKLTITGNSMFPLLAHRRDSVVLKKPEELKKYDIPLYRRENGRYILHRIIKIENGCFHTAGDNETELEYPVNKEQAVAVVSGFYRKGKYYSNKNVLYKLYTVIWCGMLPYRHKILPVLIGFRQAAGGRRAKKQK